MSVHILGQPLSRWIKVLTYWGTRVVMVLCGIGVVFEVGKFIWAIVSQP